MASLKPFVLNLDDLNFIFDQVTFRPLFDVNGNAIINWDGAGAIFDGHGNLIWNGTGLSTQAAVAAYGTSYASTTDLSGLRDVTGLNNNLLKINSEWGAVDQPFVRTVEADYSNYLQQDASANPYSYQNSHGGFAAIDWDRAALGTQSWNEAGNNYTPTISGSGPTATVTLADVVDYTPRMISRTVTTGGVTMLTESDLGFTGPNANHIVYNTPFLSDGTTVNPNYDANGIIGEAIVTDYGMLQTLGHTDYQKTNSDGTPDLTQAGSTEVFIGAENPGVAPTNGWFALFGQFFDHGLDFIEKTGGATIKIALAADDPLYGVIGPDGRPVTSITVTRATPAGVDANGDVNYINHTSPFIDQSQTYGSSEQITQLLREWVSTNNGTTYHAGMKLFDGQTLATQWKRNDGTLTNDTLPTLNELRDHVLDSKRDAITWEDVANFRNRDIATGKLLDSDAGTPGVQTTNSGQALLLDMNPRFDTAHLDAATAVGTSTVNALVDAAVATLANTAPGLAFGRSVSGGLQLVVSSGAGGPFLPDGAYTGASALAPWVNFADFSITAPPGAIHDAVGQILLAAVGDHYIAGDGRENENFGITAIHHVFHEEHNTQVRNIITTIYNQDHAATPSTHAELHKWQINTGNTYNGSGKLATNADGDVVIVTTAQPPAGGAFLLGPDNLPISAAGSYINANGSIAWDQDKMFNAAKLIVEMEYQHAAIDQYARTVTPHILEVVGYSSGIDPTVSLEYSQAAFRFGHSTLRETIDTIDPTHGLTGKIVSYALEQAFINPGLFAEKGPAAIALGMSHQQMAEVDEFITPALNQGLLGLPLDLAAINIARGRDVGLPTLNDFRGKVGLAQYVSWDDYGRNMIHPESLVNFIAAYAFDGDLARAQAIVGLVDGSIAEGDGAALGYTADQALAFMLNDAGAPAGADAFNKIDTWIGGLSEAHVPGGLLGSTFDLVFVNQMENLINGDRFYYLVRLFGQQFGEEVNNGQFKDIVERNTGLEHLNGSIFAYADKYYEFGADANFATVTIENDFINHKYGALLAANPTLGIWSDGSVNPNSVNSNGTFITTGGIQYIRDFRPDLAPDALHPVEGTPTSGSESHEVMVGTANRDYLHMRSGDDTAYGEGGDDKIFGDFGNDRLYGGDGADYIDSGDGADLVDGGAGDDLIYGYGSGTEIGGFDQLVGGSGNDTIYGGEGIDKLSGGAGDDALYGEGNTDPFTHGGDGNDYIDGGSSGDNLYGDAGDDYVYGSDDQDIVQGDSGDDILRPGKPSQAINGGPDEVIGGTGFEDDGFDIMDLSDYDVSLTGVTADMTTQQNPLVAIDGTTPFPAWFQMEGVVGTQNNDILIGDDPNVDPAAPINNVDGNNWLIGGSGNDTFTGAAGNDLIVGGSIRLDSLIGTYSGGYGNTLADGTTHRAIGALGTNGLLDAAGGLFEKHFTEMLRTERFKDLVLGDNGADGTEDLVIFSGDRADYTVERIFVNTANQGTIAAYAITDTVDGRDGTDIILGIEKIQFADGTLTPESLFNIRPDGTLAFTAVQNPNGVSNSQNAVRLSPASSILDANNVSASNPTGAVTTGITYSWLTTANNPISTNTGANPYVDAAGRLVVHTTAGTIVREKATYTDAGNAAETVLRDWNLIVGTGNNGNSGNNTLNGTNSLTVGDAIFGLAGNDTLNGQAGDDRLYGGTGNDTLNGGANNDYLDGGAGTNSLRGGSGDDLYVVNSAGDTVDERNYNGNNPQNTDAGGSDTVLSSTSYTLVSPTAAGNSFRGFIENLTLTGFGNINGTGNSLANVLTGNSGNNILDGGTGNDTMIGGAGNDTLVVDSIGDVVTELAGGGTDTIQTSLSSYSLALLASVENLTFNNGAAADVAFTGTGNASANVLTGGSAGDTLIATIDNVRDTFNGNGGNDTADYSAYTLGLTVNLGANGTTTVGGSGTGNNTDVLQSIENFVGGSAGDTITGSNGANVLNGGGGADTLTGGGGVDTLIGGLGDDTFIFDDGHTGVGTANRDIITGFGNGVGDNDTINLSAIDAITGGGDSVFNFIGTASFFDPAGTATSAGQLRYQLFDGDGNGSLESTLIQGNLNTSLAPDIEILLRNYTGPLVAADFNL